LLRENRQAKSYDSSTPLVQFRRADVRPAAGGALLTRRSPGLVGKEKESRQDDDVNAKRRRRRRQRREGPSIYQLPEGCLLLAGEAGSGIVRSGSSPSEQRWTKKAVGGGQGRQRRPGAADKEGRREREYRPGPGPVQVTPTRTIQQQQQQQQQQDKRPVSSSF
jgi:hypothetical protein